MSRRKKRPLRKSSAKLDSRRPAAGSISPKKTAENGETQDQLPDNRGEDVLTVGWMLTTMATLVTEVSAYAGWAFFAKIADVHERTNEFLALPNLLHFSALVTGCLGLVLAGLVYRIRSVPTPGLVTAVAIAICLLPLATTLIRTFF